MTDLVQLLVAGLAIGSIYAMVAIGFVLLWQTSSTITAWAGASTAPSQPPPGALRRQSRRSERFPGEPTP